MAGVPPLPCTSAPYLSRRRESFAASFGRSSLRTSAIAVAPFARSFATRPFPVSFSNRSLPGTFGFKTFQSKGRIDPRRNPIDVDTDPMAKSIQMEVDKLVGAWMVDGCTCGRGTNGHTTQPTWMASQVDGFVRRVGHRGHRTPALDGWMKGWMDRLGGTERRLLELHTTLCLSHSLQAGEIQSCIRPPRVFYTWKYKKAVQAKDQEGPKARSHERQRTWGGTRKPFQGGA